MPIIKSARKRVKVARSANLRNFRTKREMREAIKAFSKALSAGNAKDIVAAHQRAASAVDTAAKKDVIHKNKAARVKARLSSQAKAAGAKSVKATPKTAAKPAAKAKTTPKTPAKIAAKKTTAKTAAKSPKQSK